MKSNTWTKWLKLHKKLQGVLVTEKLLYQFLWTNKQSFMWGRKDGPYLQIKVVPNLLPNTLPTLGSHENRVPSWTCFDFAQYVQSTTLQHRKSSGKKIINVILEPVIFFLCYVQSDMFLHFRFGWWFSFSLSSAFTCLFISFFFPSLHLNKLSRVLKRPFVSTLRYS